MILLTWETVPTNKYICAKLWLYVRAITLIKRKKITLSFLRIEWSLYLQKLGSPSPKDALCQVWLKLAQWFWSRKPGFYNLSMCFCVFAIAWISASKTSNSSCKQTWIPFLQECFVRSLVEIGPEVLEKKIKNSFEKLTDGQQAIKKAHLSMQLKLDNNTVSKI